MNEILVIDKPMNYTSRDIVNFVCKKFHTKKVGHTGTLDPLATGVLIILIGKYTNLVELITAYDKTYEAEITLGLLTDTLDITGNILKEENVNFNESEIREVLEKMTKTYLQEVPIYSAVKVNGKRLYEYARNNQIVELPKRLVKIKKIDLISKIINENGKIKFKIRTDVSKGTYIRALINDIAKELNTIGVMSGLRRIKQGNIEITDSYKLKEIENDNFQFYPKEKIFQNIYTIDMDDAIYKKVKNGVPLENVYNQDIVLFKYKGEPIALYKNADNVLKMWKYLL